MRIIAEIWGEHIEFALGEIRGILEGEGQRYRILDVDYPVVILDVENTGPLARAGLLRRVSTHLYSGKNIPNLGINLHEYAIRVRKRGEWSEREIVRELARGIKGNVNLDNPKTIVRVYAGKRLYVGHEIYDLLEQSFEERRAKNLPVSYPITMHPRLARAMVNLARVPRSARILDPFCGTGSILIEGGLMGMHIQGSDIDERMIETSRINLKKFGMSAVLEVKDVEEINGEYDAIVTDPPYGRSSSTRGEEIYRLYKRAFRKFSEVTDNVVIVLPDKKSIDIGKEYFTLIEEYPIRVHKSLTRHYCFFKIK